MGRLFMTGWVCSCCSVITGWYCGGTGVSGSGGF